MSLRVKLPLNGNLENKGLDIIDVSSYNTTINTSGKIGSCYEFNGSNSYVSLNGINQYFTGDSNSFSISFWFYHLGNSRRGVIFGNYNIVDTVQTFNLELTAANLFRIWWKGSPDWTTTFSVTTQTWYHIVVAYDGSKLKLYANGNVVATRNGTLATLTTTSKWYIGRDGRTGATAFNGRVNDFRIYDHCLSVKEIKESYRSIVLHYKFSEYNILKSTCQDIVWNQCAKVNYNATRVTLDDSLPDERKYIVKSTLTTTTRGIYISGKVIPTDHIALVYIKFKSNFTSRPYLRYQKTTGPATYASIMPTSYVKDQWCEITRRFTGGFYPSANTGILPEDNKHYEGEYFSLPKEGGVLVFDLTLMFGAGNEPSTEDFFGMFPYLNYPYDTGTTMSFVEPVPESSGYERLGNITGTFTLSTNSARYDKCTVFDGSSYIQGPLLSLGVAQSYTLWIYITDSVPYQEIVFVDSGSKMALGFWRNNIIAACDVSCKGLFGYDKLKLNSWNHIAVVKAPNTDPILYINGENIPTIGTDYWSMTGSEFTFGRRANKASYYPYTGKISDFRMYAAVLSQDDILDIMTQSTIDNHNNLYAYEYKESTVLKIRKNGIINASAFIDENNSITKFYKSKNIKTNNLIEK